MYFNVPETQCVLVELKTFEKVRFEPLKLIPTKPG